MITLPNSHELNARGASRQRGSHPPNALPITEGGLPSSRTPALIRGLFELVLLRVIILHLGLLRIHSKHILYTAKSEFTCPCILLVDELGHVKGHAAELELSRQVR